jgi:hypothetical protein
MNNLNTLGDGPIRGLWVDDLRPLPADLQGPQWPDSGGAYWWAVATSFHDAIVVLETCPYIKHISLDHDIASFYGQREMTGYDVLMWIAQRKSEGHPYPLDIKLHTANPVGRANMQEILQQYFPHNFAHYNNRSTT